MHLVPRYRQKLAHVPLGQGRPVWVDDPHFNARYHVRHSALPAPGSDEQLRNLAGRLFALPLDRTKPLWELNLVEGLDGDRFAIISKTHHALVDGVSGVDITSVLFDTSPEPAPAARRGARVGAASRAERRGAAGPGAARARDGAGRGRPRRCARSRARRARSLGQAGEWLVGVGAMAWAGLSPAPPLAVQRADRPAPALHVGRRRGRRASRRSRTPWAARSTTSCCRAVGARPRALPAPPRRSTPTGSCSRRWCRCRCARTTQRGALGNRVAAMWAPLPVGVDRSRGRARARSPRRCAGLKESGQAVGAVGADLAGRLRAADDHVARPRGCRRASASSTSS